MYRISISRGRIITAAIFMVFLAVVWTGAGSVRADAPSGPLLTIESGFEGKCKLYGLNPVTVGLESPGSGNRGLLKVKVGERIYSCHMELGRGSKKEVHLTVPFFRANERVEAVFESGSRVTAEASHAPDILPERTVFIGVFCDSPQYLGYWEELDTTELGGGQVELVKLGGDSAYTPEELENLNFIVIEDFRTAGLGKRNENLLEQWVSKGNCLLVGSGGYSYKTLTGLLKDIKTAAAFGNGVIVPVEDGLQDKSPSFAARLISENITHYALHKAINGGDLQKQLQGAGNLNGIADAALRPDRTTTYFILSLVVLYVLAAAAAAIVAERRRPAYAVTVGVFCLLFLLLSSRSGFFKPAAAGAAVRLHGPSASTYALNCVYPGHQDEVRTGITGAGFASALDAGGGEIDPLSGEIKCSGNDGYYIYSCTREMTGSEQISLLLDREGILKGEVQNPLPGQLDNCFIIAGDTAVPVGSLDGKEKFSVDYRLEHNLKGSGDYNYLSVLYGAAQIHDLRRQLMDFYYYRLDDGEDGARLIGFSSETGSLEINGRGQKVKNTVMHVFNIHIKGESGQVSLPAETIRPVVDYGPEGAGSGNSIKREYPAEEGKEMKLYYVIPRGIIPAQITLSELPGPGWGELLVYNRSQKKWENLDGKVLAGARLQELLHDGPLALKMKGRARANLPQIALKGAVD